MRKKITFIINPISGGISKKTLPDIIERHLNHELYQAEILFTQKADDTRLLTLQSIEKLTNIIVAAGGDGTINQVAKCLINKPISLGIIPQGSGNGFARYLKIPLTAGQAINVLNHGKSKTIDTAMANEHFFVNVSGVGFDAHVAAQFANASKRGFWSYAKITVNEFRNYQLQNYYLEIDGKTYNKRAFLITFSNGDQYGNNAFIAPGADMQDGLLDIAILKNVKVTTMPRLAFEMFTQRFNRSKDVEIVKGKHIRVLRENAGMVNIDGEPFEMGKEIMIKVIPSSLSVVVP
ncbi:MAG: diacylglycerol kinase family lipid kinase [Bacteroidia bacterium]|nr:diacylglycerol kinase family lipid kinase [Bacteroidia bacterium]